MLDREDKANEYVIRDCESPISLTLRMLYTNFY